MDRAEQRERTRQMLVRQARVLFARQGYATVSLAQIVAAAAVTKGALYHHFDGKAALFHAVVEEVQRQVGDRVAAAADAQDEPWDQLVAGCHAFVAVGRDPDVAQIMLVDGPTVLGWNEWRALDEEFSARRLTEALRDLIGAGVVRPQPVEPLARLLSGAMNEAALWLARPTADPADLPAVIDALAGLLHSLRARPTPG